MRGFHLCCTGSDRGGCKTLVQRKRRRLARRRHRDSSTVCSSGGREVGMAESSVSITQCHNLLSGKDIRVSQNDGTNGIAAPKSCRSCCCALAAVPQPVKQARRPGRQCARHVELGWLLHGAPCNGGRGLQEQPQGETNQIRRGLSPGSASAAGRRRLAGVLLLYSTISSARLAGTDVIYLSIYLSTTSVPSSTLHTQQSRSH